jgi:hypothetical protein
LDLERVLTKQILTLSLHHDNKKKKALHVLVQMGGFWILRNRGHLGLQGPAGHRLMGQFTGDLDGGREIKTLLFSRPSSTTTDNAAQKILYLSLLPLSCPPSPLGGRNRI